MQNDQSSSLEYIVIKLLASRQHTLSVAESMSGGNLAARLTSIPGASGVFMGGIIVYSALAKSVLAELDLDFITMHGTVSKSVTSELALATKKNLCTDWSLAITGNAGPTSDKGSLAPVGVCFVAIAGPCEVECVTVQFRGSRTHIQMSSVDLALTLLRRRFLACM